MEASSQMQLSLRRLDYCEEDLEALQEVLEAAPAYHRRMHGGEAGPEEAVHAFEEIPPGVRADEKRVYGLERAGEMTGCADVLYRYPNPSTACIGLLLLREDVQRQGYGRRAYEMLESTIVQTSPCRTLRIGILETNLEVEAFWRKMGFAPTGQYRPWQAGSISTRVKVMQKELPPRQVPPGSEA